MNMRMMKWYSIDIDVDSEKELNSVFEAASDFFAMYDEVTIHYEVRPSTDFCASITRKDHTISWSNFNTNKHGEEQFEKLTPEIFKEVFSNA